MNRLIVKRMSSNVRWAFNWKEWNPKEGDFLRAISCVQQDEKERLGKFVFRKDVRASLIGRLMMRKFVSEYARLPYENIKFVRDAHNKPAIEGVYGVSFNVSHQGNYTVLAGETEDVKLGVDIMKLEYTGGKELSEFFRIMNSNFSYDEWKEIKGERGEKEQISMFCRHWALKESYVKALGTGITVDLKNIDFRTASKLIDQSVINNSVLYVNGEEQDWLFEESLIDFEHCVAVALAKNRETRSFYPKFELLNYESLIERAVPLLSEDSAYVNKYFAKDEMP